MSALKSLASAGKGKIAAILPDTTSSTRYVEFDEPDLKKAMAMAGLPATDIIVQNGQSSDSTFLTDAQSDITNGASVLLIAPEDSGTGVTVENAEAILCQAVATSVYYGETNTVGWGDQPPT